MIICYDVSSPRTAEFVCRPRMISTVVGFELGGDPRMICISGVLYSTYNNTAISNK